MTQILFFLIILPISYLPISILHSLSDFLSYVIYRIVGYRKTVVLDNMRRSFPEKNETEIDALARQFYRHFCDVLVESVRLFTISERELMERVEVRNPELLQPYYQEGREVIIITAHRGNWEWCVTALNQKIPHQAVSVYKKLSNELLEEELHRAREKFGTQMVRKKDFIHVIREVAPMTRAFVLAADQSPYGKQKVYWTSFLNQETPVMRGAEVYAKRYNCVVVMLDVERVKRGYYEISLQLVTETPQAMATNELTERYTHLLEQAIKKSPHNWLWSHRRWKRKRTEAEV